MRARTAVLAVLGVAACHGRPTGTLDSPRASASRIGAAAAPAPTDVTTQFAMNVAASFAARDAKAIGALFGDDASFLLVGESHDAHGRDGLEKLVGELLATTERPSLSVGRVWVGKTVSVIEFDISGVSSSGIVEGQEIPERPFGLVGACAVTFDAGGLVRSLRAYVDLPTYLGQTGREAGSRVRAVTTASPTGAAVFDSKGTPTEARNIEVANGVWAALEAHDVENAMAPMADGYVYEDYAGPAALSKEGTTQLVARFLGALTEFKIAAKPVNFAAGDDVITETDEIAIFRAKPSDKRISLHGITVMRFDGGKIVEQWQYADSRELWTQLRVMPEK